MRKSRVVRASLEINYRGEMTATSESHSAVSRLVVPKGSSTIRSVYTCILYSSSSSCSVDQQRHDHFMRINFFSLFYYILIYAMIYIAHYPFFLSFLLPLFLSWYKMAVYSTEAVSFSSFFSWRTLKIEKMGSVKEKEVNVGGVVDRKGSSVESSVRCNHLASR